MHVSPKPSRNIPGLFVCSSGTRNVVTAKYWSLGCYGALTVGVLDPGSVIRGVGSKTFTALTSYFGCFVTKITGYMIFARAGIRGITCSSLFSLCRGSYGTTQLGGVKGDGFEGHYMSTPATPALMREGLLKMFNPVFLLHNLNGYPLFS
jgi:hypothetical protein